MKADYAARQRHGRCGVLRHQHLLAQWREKTADYLAQPALLYLPTRSFKGYGVLDITQRLTATLRVVDDQRNTGPYRRPDAGALLVESGKPTLLHAVAGSDPFLYCTHGFYSCRPSRKAASAPNWTKRPPPQFDQWLKGSPECPGPRTQRHDHRGNSAPLYCCAHQGYDERGITWFTNLPAARPQAGRQPVCTALQFPGWS